MTCSRQRVLGVEAYESSNEAPCMARCSVHDIEESSLRYPSVSVSMMIANVNAQAIKVYP
jgi:hypothetical protein